MTAPPFPVILREAADAIDVLPRVEIAALLRRAALRIENTSPTLQFDASWDAALMSVAAELDMTREDAIRALVREWLITNAYLPLEMLEEDGEAAGRS